MLDLHKQLSAAKTPHEQAALQRQVSGSSEHWWASHQWHAQRQIEATDRQTCPDEGRIDQKSSGTETRGYALYGLTEKGRKSGTGSILDAAVAPFRVSRPFLV